MVGAAGAELEPAPNLNLGGAPALLGGGEAQGLLAWRLAVAFEEARELFRRHRGLIEIGQGRSEWPNLRADLLELASPGPISHKLRTSQRVRTTYRLFQQV